MLQYLARKLGIAIFLFTMPLAGAANADFGGNNCALIVASRHTLTEVRQFIGEHRQIPIYGVFESRNGWYAIASRLVNKDDAKGTIARLAAVGSIPGDSYCSDGSSYLRAVAGFGASGAMGNASTDPMPIELHDDFDARPMKKSEKRLLQSALAIQGYYFGLIDGAWGRGSQAAIERFSLSEFDSEPTNAHAAAAVLFALDEIIDGDWSPQAFPGVGAYMLLPEKRMVPVTRTSEFVKLRDAENNITVTMALNSPQSMLDLHAYALGEDIGPNAPYVVRKDDFWVTSIVRPSLRMYIRSRLNRSTQQWATVVVSSPADAIGSGLIIASLSDSPVPPLELPEGGYIDEQTDKLIALMEENNNASPAAAPIQDASRPDSETPPTLASIGTGFYVNADSTLVTNAHVVNGCASISADSEPADVVASDSAYDLAIVRPRYARERQQWLAFSDAPARLNSDVTVAGFPLHGLLGGLNVTRGAISSLKGIGGDTIMFQISAPVQAGNSGGPVVDRSGRVVGVVVAKLDSQAVAEAFGDVPQNVNFAVRGEVAKLFLSANGVQLHVENTALPMDGADLADVLKANTALIECNPAR